jgi:hypothetical protein
MGPFAAAERPNAAKAVSNPWLATGNTPAYQNRLAGLEYRLHEVVC